MHEPRQRARRLSEILWLSILDYLNDAGPQWAAAMAYYGLLSMFPLLILVGALIAFMVDPSLLISQGTALLADLLPRGEEQIAQIVSQAVEQRTSLGIFSMLFLLWSASRVFAAAIKALNVAFDVDEHYTFFRRTMFELGITVTIGVVFVVALGLRTLLSLLWLNNWAGGDLGRSLIRLGIESSSMILLMVAFYLMYSIMPRRKINWRSSLFGALVATLLFVLARPIFTYYLEVFSQYNLIYGPLALLATIVIWTWYVANIAILGGEITSHGEDIWLRQMDPGEVTRRHELRSPTKIGMWYQKFDADLLNGKTPESAEDEPEETVPAPPPADLAVSGAGQGSAEHHGGSRLILPGLLIAAVSGLAWLWQRRHMDHNQPEERK